MNVRTLPKSIRCIKRIIFRTPARIVVFGFVSLILCGTGLLMIPVMSVSEIPFLDALFTATSASCVTGLSVFNVNSTLTLPGQLVLLTLIQVGGLGIMTFSILFILLMGKNPSLMGLSAIKDSYANTGEKSVKTIIKEIFMFTALFELVGAVLLFFYFRVQQFDWWSSFYAAVFHSISAFCNAGFSLFSDSMMGFRDSWYLNLVLSLLIVSGGMGFLVYSELIHSFPFHRRSWQRFSLHFKIVISSTLFLLVVSTVVILMMEWRNALNDMGISGRIVASLFQAVSSRTAGFNSLPIGTMANETLFFIIILMYIGAGPGSCAGGVKITTFSTLLYLGFSKLMGRRQPHVFKRSISSQSIDKAISIVLLSSIAIFTGILVLLISEIGEVSHMESRGRFLELVFEVVSAFGTVGLSTGVTETLSTVGKIVIILLMFIGRLGPLTVVLAISQRDRGADFYYAEEDIMVG